VKVSLYVGGKLVDPRNAPIVQGRRGLLRVSVQTEPGWQPREVVARLDLSNTAGALPPMEIKSPVLASSNDGDLKTTFNFDLAPATISADLAWAVSLREVGPDSVGTASPGAAFPDPAAGQKVWLGAESSGPALKMVIVPINYNADGSGRLPDLGDEQMARYKTALEQVFPAASVEFRIHDPIGWDKPVEAGGNGWSDLLQNILFQRQQDRFTNVAAANEFYYGLFSPAVGFSSYCGGGQCLLGLSSGLDDPAEEYVRGSIGVGFTGPRSANTMAHETGHAHGRLHAPCAPGGFIQQLDAAYPYPDAELGTWGLDLASSKLYDPNGDARDIMSYCDPRWVSDYTYKALFTRMAFVNSSADLVTVPFGESRSYRSYSIDADGRLALGRTFEIRMPLRGESRTVELLDQNGNVRRRVEGHFYPHSDLPGGFVLGPEPGPGDFAVRLVSKTGRSAILPL
jgi:hypothetical protein